MGRSIGQGGRGSTVTRGTPFHTRTSAICESYAWRHWSGYVVASSYEHVPEMEYHGIRTSAGLLDVSPLFKYHIHGRDAEKLLNRVITRDVRKCAEGQVIYTPWCDERGKTIDDGTVWRLGPNSFRMTAAEPNLKWLLDNAPGLEVEVEDVSEDIAVLALQGPMSREILRAASTADVDGLRYFRFTEAKLKGMAATISRTGYTGDLGYEIWVSPDDAEAVWDALMERGKAYDITPAGMLALDIARIEAGFILSEVDYLPARMAVIESQAYSPLELSLDWTVAFDKGPFMGRRALEEERDQGPPRRIVGLEVDWNAAEKLYAKYGLPPEPPRLAWRSAIPVYGGVTQLTQVGKATSGCWSPLLKRYLVLATVAAPFAHLGTRLAMEVTIEGERRTLPATVVKRPFFDPPRKKG